MGSRKGANLKKTTNGAVISPKPDSNAKIIKLSKRTSAPLVKMEASSGSICAKAETMILSKEQLKTQEVCPVKRQKIAIKEPKLVLEQTLKHCAKLKLQLFPIDERTRKRLEKDNHNPHLELTLSARKRITSVLKHLNSKWGNSNAASGELMLFPYNIDLINLAGCMTWTSKHVETSIGDVYGIIGRPAIFRLRYGWISNPRERFLEEPLASFSVKDPLQLEDLGKECKSVNITGGGRQPSREPLPVLANVLSDSKEDRKETIDGEDNQRSDAATMSIRAWADCISNISMGSLFSDASRLGLMASKGDSHLRQASVNSDSFDAAIAAHLGRHQSAIPTTQELQTSILDAEETCQGFLFQKPESFRDAIPFSSKCHSEKVKPELLHKERPACPVEPGSNSETNRSCQDDDTNELGIPDLSWSCSLGPCDLGHLSSSRQIIGGDSISLSGLFATSLDAVQNFPLRSKDEVAPTV